MLDPSAAALQFSLDADQAALRDMAHMHFIVAPSLVGG
jgi:hypothetical protein